MCAWGPQAGEPGCGRVPGSSRGAHPPRARRTLLLPGRAGLVLRMEWPWRESLCPRAMSPPGCLPEGGLLRLPSQPCPHRPHPAHPEAWGHLHPGQARAHGQGTQSSECRAATPAPGRGGGQGGGRRGVSWAGRPLERWRNSGPCAGRPPLPGAARGPWQVTVPTQGDVGVGGARASPVGRPVWLPHAPPTEPHAAAPGGHRGPCRTCCPRPWTWATGDSAGLGPLRAAVDERQRTRCDLPPRVP